MTRIAVIDIGTVTARLAVADVEGSRVVRMEKRSTICDLGVGVDRTGTLDHGAMERVALCVRDYVAIARDRGAQATACTLTSAARDAANAPDLGMALASLGLEPMVVPGEVEGALTFLGVAQDLPGRRILVADSGGGSTELVCGRLDATTLDISYVCSTDVGCRRITDRYLSAPGVADPEDLRRAHEFAAGLLASAVAEGGLRAGCPDGPSELVVCGGTVTSLVAIDGSLDPYDPAKVHLQRLSRERVNELEGLLARLPVEGRAALPGLQAKRAPVILAGAVAISELLSQTGFGSLVASESDLLFGLAVTAAQTLAGAVSPVVWRPELRPLP